MSEVLCVVGLGNPGSKYRYTRHNIGFECVDDFLERYSDTFGIVPEKFRKGDLYKGISGDVPVFLLKPSTYMNLSGQALKEMKDKFSLKSENILIIYDDMDFDFGKIKLKPRGSAGGHNGISDIIEKMGTNEIKRVRVGIGKPNEGDSSSYVLGKFFPEESEKILNLCKLVSQIIKEFFEGKSFDKIMSLFNNSIVLSQHSTP